MKYSATFQDKSQGGVTQELDGMMINDKMFHSPTTDEQAIQQAKNIVKEMKLWVGLEIRLVSVNRIETTQIFPS